MAARDFASAFLAFTLIERGDLDEAERVLQAPTVDKPANPGPLICAFSRGVLLLARGRPADAAARLHKAGALWRRLTPNQSFIPYLAHAATAHHALGQAAEARQLAAEQLSQARRLATAPTLGAALRTTGVVTGGRRGLELLRDAVHTLERSEARLEHAHALVDLGAALRQAGHRRDAQQPLRSGLDLATRYGAHPLAECARQELVATGARPRTRFLSGRDALTTLETGLPRHYPVLTADRDARPRVALSLGGDHGDVFDQPAQVRVSDGARDRARRSHRAQEHRTRCAACGRPPAAVRASGKRGSCHRRADAERRASAVRGDRVTVPAASGGAARRA